MAVDVGMVRIGVAYANDGSMIALPLETVQASKDGSDVKRIVELVGQIEPIEVIVGLPRLMSGKEGKSAQMARSFARRMARALPQTPIRMVDERLTTTCAKGKLQEAFVDGRDQKKIIDQQAASEILQYALQIEQGSGKAPGELVII